MTEKTILRGVVRDGFSGEQRPEKQEAVSPVKIWGQSIPKGKEQEQRCA